MSDKDNDAPLGGTVMMDEGVSDSALDKAFDGTVMLDDDGPTVAPDGTVMIDSAANPAPAEGSVRSSPSGIDGRKSAPPPLPNADDTSLPPSLGPTPAPPEADMTFDRSKLGEDTTDDSPAPAPSSNFFAPAVSKKDIEKSAAETKADAKPSSKPAPKSASKTTSKAAETKPAASKPAETASQPSTTQTAAKTSAKTPSAAAKTQSGAKTAGAKTAGAKTAGAAKPAPANKKKGIPAWAQLLAVVVAAGVIGHLIARSQEETPSPTPVAQPAPKPRPTPKQSAKPKLATAAQPAPTAKTPPTPASAEPTPAPPAPVAPPPAPTKAADLSACVKEQMDATLPSDKLAFVCEEADANKAQRKMSTLLASTDESERDARGAYSKLGWYRMAHLQIVRTRCCGDARPFALAEALSACGLGTSLTALHEADRNKTSYDTGLAAYRKAVDCLFKANTMRMFGIIARPGEYQHDSFVKTLSKK